MSDLSSGEVARVREVYDYGVSLVDDLVANYNPYRDDAFNGGVTAHSTNVKTVRFSLLEAPSLESSPPPYSSVLAKTAIVAFQQFRFGQRSPEGDTTRKIELLDPFKELGSHTLLMATLNARDLLIPEIPEARVIGEEVERGLDPLIGNPFRVPELTEKFMQMLQTIRGLSDSGRLTQISMDDLQAMYAFGAELQEP